MSPRPDRPAPAIVSRTIDTPDGPFTAVVGADASVIASGWTPEPDPLLARISRRHIARAISGQYRIGPPEGPTGDPAGDRGGAPKPRFAPGPAATRTPDTVAMRAALTRAVEAVDAYYNGDHAAPQNVRVSTFGTEFQRAGWDALRTITPGSPLTYAEFAEVTGRASAVRAAASVCARNAVGLFIPCHRVLRTDGNVGEFAWGADLKAALLTRERA